MNANVLPHNMLCNRFDAGQAALFFSLLCVLVFDKTLALSVGEAYGIQSIALVLLACLRYSKATGHEEKAFFLNLGVYLAVYGALSVLDYRIEAHGWKPGSVVDLCWTLPPLLFTVLTVFSASDRSSQAEERDIPSIDPVHHLHGTSSTGLFVLSISTGIFLYQRQHTLGAWYLSASALLFFTRSACRESQLFRAHADLKKGLTHDSLTGLLNRKGLDRRPTFPEGADVILCSLDRFKVLNETFGRAMMDDVLVQLAHRFSAVPALDLLLRVGGDEFLAVFRKGSASVTQELADAVRRPFHLDNRRITLTATLGQTIAGFDEGTAEVLSRAEAAVLHGKQHGRNRVVKYEARMRQDTKSLLSFEADLKEAIATGAIQNFYQPIYSSAQGMIVGYEALARWLENDIVIATPDRFIPVAETTGMIIELGRSLLRHACRDAARLTEAAGRKIWVSVNVSAKQFEDPALIQHIAESLTFYGLAPTQLKLEVTESVLVDPDTNAREMLEAARALGMSVALDDFGTGFSSLSYLLDLPFDIIKIDRSFVKMMHAATERHAIVKAIVELARTLGKETVAEGVELEEQQLELEALGCDYLQGYKFSKPINLITALSVAKVHTRASLSFDPDAYAYLS